MSPPLPTIGAGEPLDTAMSRVRRGGRRAGAGRRQARGRRHPLGRAGVPRHAERRDEAGPCDPTERSCPVGRPRPPGRSVGIMRGFSTNAIHAGQEPDPTTGRGDHADPPVVHLRPGRRRWHARRRLRVLAQREPHPHRAAGVPGRAGGRPARPARSAPGWAPPTCCCGCCCAPGDHVVIPHDAYGGTFRLVDKVLAPWGVEYTPVDLGDIDALRAALRPTTRVVWCETPTNPLLGIADIAAVADVAREAGRPARRRQHLRLALPAAAARARRRRGAALHHQVPRRALRRRRRRARDQRRRAGRAAARSPRTPSARCPARSTPGSPCAG